MKWLYIASAVTLVLAWLVPDHYHPWSAFYQDYLAFVALLLLFLAECRISKKISFLFIFFVLAFIVVCIQLLLGVYSFLSDALMSVIYLAGGLVAYQVGISTPHRDLVVNGLAVAVVFGALVSAIIGMSQWLELSSPWTFNVGDGRASANLAQANNFSTLLFWGVCSAVYLVQTRTISVPTFIIFALVITWGIAVSESRTPILQFAFMAAWIFWGGRGRTFRRSGLMFVPMVFFLVFYLSFPAVDGAVNFVETEGPRVVSGEYSNRVQTWLWVVKAITDSDWLGYGWGQVSISQFSNLAADSPRVGFVEHSHNILLDLLVWNGPFFGGVLIALAAYWLGRQFLRTQCIKTWFLLACVGGVVIHTCLEFPIEYAYFLLPFALMLGLVDNFQGSSYFLPVSKRAYGLAVLTPSLVLMVFIWHEYRMLENDHRLMRAQNFGLPVPSDLVLSDSVVLLDGEREFIRFGRTMASKNMSSDDLEWMKKITYRYPLAVVIYRYSVALSLNGRLQEAEVELNKIKALYGDSQYSYYKHYWEQALEQGRE